MLLETRPDNCPLYCFCANQTSIKFFPATFLLKSHCYLAGPNSLAYNFPLGFEVGGRDFGCCFHGCFPNKSIPPYSALPYFKQCELLQVVYHNQQHSYTYYLFQRCLFLQLNLSGQTPLPSNVWISSTIFASFRILFDLQSYIANFYFLSLNLTCFRRNWDCVL